MAFLAKVETRRAAEAEERERKANECQRVRAFSFSKFPRVRSFAGAPNGLSSSHNLLKLG